jgi:hypothetical protein
MFEDLIPRKYKELKPEEKPSRYKKFIGDDGLVGSVMGVFGGELAYCLLGDNLDAIYPEYSAPLKLTGLIIMSGGAGLVAAKTLNCLGKGVYGLGKDVYNKYRQ